MPDLSKDAIDHLWPVLQIIGAVVAMLSAFVIGLWRGFRWLREQIRETAKAMVGPVSEMAIAAKRSADKAHRRVDRMRAELGLKPDPYDLDTKP